MLSLPSQVRCAIHVLLIRAYFRAEIRQLTLIFLELGLILSLHRHAHPASTVQSSVLAKQLLQNFVRPENMSDVGGSDEVQFAALVSLSFITPLAAVDEKLVASVLSVFNDSLDDDTVSPNPSRYAFLHLIFLALAFFCLH